MKEHGPAVLFLPRSGGDVRVAPTEPEVGFGFSCGVAPVVTVAVVKSA
jgi:hypothetical protein